MPYAGKPEAGSGTYYLDKTFAYVQYLVREVMKDIDLQVPTITININQAHSTNQNEKSTSIYSFNQARAITLHQSK